MVDREDQPGREAPVSESEYDEEWIRETWGWDTPERFVETQGRNLRPRIRASLDLAGLRPGMRVLDIGCGRGEAVLHCGRNGIDAVGADYSRDAIALAERAKATHTPGEQSLMRFMCGDVKEFSQDESFDRIFMLDLVEHLRDWELAELFTVCGTLLKDDGAIIVHTLPNRWVYDITYGKLLRLLRPSLPRDPRSEKEKAIHVNEMSITHLDRLLREAGFASRVWLKDLIVEQARWHAQDPLGDRRGKLYRLMCNPIIGGLYRLAALTPLRLLIVNEMFGVAWRSGHTSPIRLPLRLTERLVLQRARG